PTFGGGTRSAELTLPGFVHDVCSAVHPFGRCSPAWRGFPLERHGLKWIVSPVPLAHPFDDGDAAVSNDLARRFLRPLVAGWDELAADILGPLRPPRHPLLYARFGMLAPWPAAALARAMYRDPKQRALFGGIAAHSIVPLNSPLSSAIAWPLWLAGQSAGWPIPQGGAQKIADALGCYLRSLGGRIVTSHRVKSLRELGDGDVILADLTPRQLVDIAGAEMPASYTRRLRRFRFGPGVFQMDWALSGPIPWTAPQCAKACTVHLCGTLEEIEASEIAPWKGEHERRPFILLAQPTLFDDTRAPQGKHIAWAYCHVPNASTVDMSDRIEEQVERFAPGFRSLIIGRSKMNSLDLQARNENLQGGDVAGGAMTVSQFFLRPTVSMYRTPRRGLYLCSSSTPPGAGVHGMCGYQAARAALHDLGVDME
ncbi:MAG: NAD(P)/FAD-dependent oxidoreductase, partial [Acidobacteriaceae bacterium]|nr:NAD(P)/FAD-dependent oxidoreductase [Acidobacteriaceae bacterium]